MRRVVVLVAMFAATLPISMARADDRRDVTRYLSATWPTAVHVVDDDRYRIDQWYVTASHSTGWGSSSTLHLLRQRCREGIADDRCHTRLVAFGEATDARFRFDPELGGAELRGTFRLASHSEDGTRRAIGRYRISVATTGVGEIEPGGEGEPPTGCDEFGHWYTWLHRSAVSRGTLVRVGGHRSDLGRTRDSWLRREVERITDPTC
jgi:hypothetical protein